MRVFPDYVTSIANLEYGIYLRNPSSFNLAIEMTVTNGLGYAQIREVCDEPETERDIYTHLANMQNREWNLIKAYNDAAIEEILAELANSERKYENMTEVSRQSINFAHELLGCCNTSLQYLIEDRRKRDVTRMTNLISQYHKAQNCFLIYVPVGQSSEEGR